MSPLPESSGNLCCGATELCIQIEGKDLTKPSRRPSTAPRIADVAELAGVSTATVSRALALPDQVRPETLALVMDAVKQSGYRPNSSARNLRTQRTRLILVVVPSIANPIFASVMRGIDAQLAEAGYGVMIGNLDNNAGMEPRFVELAFAREVDGVMLLNGWIPRSGAHSLMETGLPVVAMCAGIGDPRVPDITADDFGSGRNAARHLVELGHRQLGYAAGPKGTSVDAARWTGFQSMALELGIPSADICRFEGLGEARFAYRSGVECAAGFLAKTNRSTGVFAASDEIAIAFIDTVQRAGLTVPGDVSVLGFDGIDAGNYMRPTLSSFHQPRHELGRTGARVLLKLIAGTALPQDYEVRIPVPLVERESTAALTSMNVPERVRVPAE